MEVYRTKDGQVSKYVHDDGSETAIKTVSSCANILNKATGKIEPVDVDRNKFAVFVSSSVGCPLGCKFCYLTLKKYPYYKLTPKQILNNVKEALTEEVKFKPEIRKMYMKLGWMGMGDAFLLKPYDLRRLSIDILHWAIGDSGCAFGLDGVDIATIMPKGADGWPHQMVKLNDYLYDRHNRNNYDRDRTPVRLFYSLHGVGQRKSMIPGGRFNAPIGDLQLLKQFNKWYGIDVILHHMLLEGVNDSKEQCREITLAIRNLISNAELRILRFNECDASPYKETKNFDELVKLFSDTLPRIKYQVSAGSEIKAACGQFLCSNIKEK